jgi:O-antigen biosynthesis protein
VIDASLPRDAAGAWCELWARTRSPQTWWAKLELTDPARDQVVREFFLGPVRRRGGWRRRATLVHVPAESAGLRLRVFADDVPDLDIRLHVLPRWQAAAKLLWFGRYFILSALAGAPAGLAGRLRALLGQAPARAGEPPQYAAWIAWFEKSPPPSPDFDVQVVVLGQGDAADDTLASVAAQSLVPAHPVLRIAAQDDWAAVRARWVVILRAGEMLSPHALAWFAHASFACPRAVFITADCDDVSADGVRHDPLFKPVPDRVLLPFSTPVRGACAALWPDSPPPLPVQGDAARLFLAALNPDLIAHVPHILTHIGPHAVPVESGLTGGRRATDFAPAVTMLIPSAARSRHVVQCVRHLFAATSYTNFTVAVALAAPAAADPRVLRHLREMPKLRIQELDIVPFNYAAVNNTAARAVESDLLLLLNDDVAPIDPHWLDSMVAYMRDPRVGVVGARLLYGNGMVQHEGVIMGLANLCEHAGRLRPATDPGPHRLALLPREVSAVTAACLLIRTELYRRLGGMDEAFGVALNDVDLCLRVRQAGHSVVYCPQAVLHHYESLSLGRHYAGERAVLESLEVRRLRARWGSVIASDPFYNPQASLEPGREWQPAFPPRAAPPARMAAKPVASH